MVRASKGLFRMRDEWRPRTTEDRDRCFGPQAREDDARNAAHGRGLPLDVGSVMSIGCSGNRAGLRGRGLTPLT